MQVFILTYEIIAKKKKTPQNKTLKKLEGNN